jgi:predicted GH43/DUF377 family glycosyl hydrolase
MVQIKPIDEVREALAESRKGLMWSFRRYPANPVLDVGASGTWDSHNVGDAQVLKVGGVYYMFYFGWDGVCGRQGVAMAYSPLGPWVKSAANPILNVGGAGSWDEYNACKGYVVYNPLDDKFYMFYMGEAAGGKRRIGLATTSWASFPTGWSKYSGNPILEDGDVADAPYVAYNPEDNLWYMTYMQRSDHNMHYATSPDLLNWTKRGTLLDRVSGTWENWVEAGGMVRLPFPLKWLMCYIACTQGDYRNGVYRWGLAFSGDLKSWERFTANPVFDVGLNSWERRHVYFFKPFIEDGIIYAYYNAAQSVGGAERIGLATCPLAGYGDYTPREVFTYLKDEDSENFWKGFTIGAGDRTAAIYVGEWRRKTLYFMSNVSGTLTIEVDPVGDGDFDAYDLPTETATVSANTLKDILIEEDAKYVRLSFNRVATVTAKIAMAR